MSRYVMSCSCCCGGNHETRYLKFLIQTRDAGKQENDGQGGNGGGGTFFITV